VGVGDSKDTPWINGFQSEKTLLRKNKDKKWKTKPRKNGASSLWVSSPFVFFSLFY
jgi:hypothetical protein